MSYKNICIQKEEVRKCSSDSPDSPRCYMWWRRLSILVPEAYVLRLEDLSVGRFAAGDNVQLVHGLHHSPA